MEDAGGVYLPDGSVITISPPSMAICGGRLTCVYGSCLISSSESFSISTSASCASSGSGVASGVGWLGKSSIAGVPSGRVGGEGVVSSTNVLKSFSVVVVGPHTAIGFTLSSDLAGRGGLGISDTMGFRGCVSMRLSGPSWPRFSRRDGGLKSSGSSYTYSAPPCPSPNVGLEVIGEIWEEGPPGDTGLMGVTVDADVGDVNVERGNGAVDAAGMDIGGP
jgi:hypothetical protein